MEVQAAVEAVGKAAVLVAQHRAHHLVQARVIHLQGWAATVGSRSADGPRRGSGRGRGLCHRGAHPPDPPKAQASGVSTAHLDAQVVGPSQGGVLPLHGVDAALARMEHEVAAPQPALHGAGGGAAAAAA